MNSARKIDRRLLGTWKSDKRKTFEYYRPKPGTSPGQVRKLKSLFGKLILCWGRSQCYSEFRGEKEKCAYEVLGSDSESVVLRIYCWPDPIGGRLCHIHFEEDYYWVYSSGIREYFKRVKDKS